MTDPAPGKRCGKCGTHNAPQYKYCVSCGAPLSGTYSLVSSSRSGRFAIARLLHDGGAERSSLDRHLSIGRDGADVTIAEDQFLSARHAEVTEADGRFVLRDLRSTNGTYVRIRGEVELRPGDCLMIGGQVFKFVV